ncbi:MAG: hypothetical protein AAF244_03180 [Pseudomonadota bacterium]
MLDLLAHDTNIWVALSFILFAVFAFFAGRKSITAKLDSHINEVKLEIENAERLRVEAQELLAQYQRKQRDAEEEASSILENAKAQAKQSQKDADKELKETMARREEQLAERLQRLEENAIGEIQNYAAQLAVQATREMIVQTMDESTNADLNAQAIDNLPKNLN